MHQLINIAALLARVDLIDVVTRHGVTLKKSGKEYSGLCPFHSETSPSFTVSPVKGFVHCFGCGAHYDAIGFVMAFDGVDFVTACHQLGGHDMGTTARQAVRTAPRLHDQMPDGLWIPICPVPDDAPRWVPGVKGRVWNIKRDRWWEGLTPARADAYRDPDGALLGYVLRVNMPDGKITPAVTWCIGPKGDARWCLQPFPDPRPLFGLDQLAAKPAAPVLMVEGEKCATVGAGALPMYAVTTWMGGSHGVKHTDFSPLEGRDVVLWPDALDGVGAMLGYIDGSGLLREGVAQLAWAAGVRSLRVIDAGGMKKGWDIADAVADGWTAKQIALWAKSRVKRVEVQETRRVMA